jgi:rod shape-determining protein MreB
MKGLLAFVRQLATSTPEYFFDIGSTTTRVISNSRLVYCEPTCLAVHKTGAVAAIGNKAFSLLGKTAPSVEVIFPVLRGNWVSAEYAEVYLRALQAQLAAPATLSSYILGVSGALCTSATMNPLQSQLHTQVLQRSSLQRVQLRARPEALFAHCRVSKSDSEILAIVDLGGQVTEASILVGGEIVRTSFFSWGGVRLTERVQQIVREEHSCALGWQAAEEVKRQLLRFYGGTPKAQAEKWRSTKLAARGKDVVTQTAKTVVLSADQFVALGEQVYAELSENLHDFFSEVPSELAATVLSEGVRLSGGSSQLKGLKEALEKTLNCEVRVNDRPELDAVEGLAEARK